MKMQCKEKKLGKLRKYFTEYEQQEKFPKPNICLYFEMILRNERKIFKMNENFAKTHCEKL